MSELSLQNPRLNTGQENTTELALGQALFNTLFAANNTGLLIFNRQLQYVYINEALAEINGLPAADHIGKSLREVLPELAAIVEPMMQGILDTGTPIIDYELTGKTPKQPGVIRYWLGSYYPLYDDSGAIFGVGGLVIEISDRKKAQKALQESEERYRSLIKATSQIVWTTDAEGRTTELGDWSAYTGKSLAEMADYGWGEAIHPEDREHSTQAWIKALQTKSLYDTEFRIRGKDGNYRYFANKGVPILDADGNVREWMGTCTDIHDRKQAEIALQLSEERYRYLIKASSQMIWSIDAEGRANDSPEWREFTGQSLADGADLGWSAVIHPDDRERTLQLWMEALYQIRLSYPPYQGCDR